MSCLGCRCLNFSFSDFLQVHLVKLIARLSARFGVAVSNKAAAQEVTVIGAVGGATVNWVFMSHFQNMARGHFSVRRLERMYGIEDVCREYEQV
nr:EcsC family protein [Desulfonatronospira thiodismutans]